MSKRKELLSVSYHTDTETGNERVGEIDFGISGTVKEYLKEYGLKGKDEIIKTLAYLMYYVEFEHRQNAHDGGGDCGT